ncbi:MAG: DMT family transporter [Prevotella sp.]|nr:DMT family transporter [Bacteroides sp.]MCM1366333.1 DMT family transporter [Prevotella sp.]MCM1436309.1 DMT family transporter [Prevotella sp.]
MTARKSIGRNASPKIFGHLGALAVVVCWGVSFLSTKVLMEQGGFSPVEVFVYRFTIAWAALMLFTCRKIFSDNFKDELKFIVCGICSGSIYFLTENYALQNTTAGNVSLLSAVSPIFTTILAAIVFKTKVKPGVAIGSLVAFAGVVCVVMQGSTEGIEIHPVGDLLALSSALSWAVYSIVSKDIIPRYNALFITRKMFFYGTLTAIPLLLIQNEPLHLNLLFENPRYLMNILFLALMCSLGAFVLFNLSMKILGPITANNYIYLQPLVTMVAAYFVFGEKVYLLGYLGCVLVIGGLVLTDKWNPKLSFLRKD